MAISTVFALFVVVLICVQAAEVRNSAFATESRRRTGDVQRSMEGDSELCPQSYGIFGYEDDCHKFVICTDGEAEVKTCPEGDIYQESVGCIEGVCPSLLKSEDGENEVTRFQCSETGRFADPNNCENYFECSVQSDGVDTTMVHCPSDQHYNIETKQCDDKCRAQCDQDLACSCQWPHCLITCEEPNGFFPIPTNCRLYLMCVNSLPRIRRCPEDMAFDSERRECVNIEETNCVTESNDILGIMRN